ncbi:hypothetical protein K0M31_014462, partial [Melipona bicolor]
NETCYSQTRTKFAGSTNLQRDLLTFNRSRSVTSATDKSLVGESLLNNQTLTNKHLLFEDSRQKVRNIEIIPRFANEPKNVR